MTFKFVMEFSGQHLLFTFSEMFLFHSTFSLYEKNNTDYYLFPEPNFSKILEILKLIPEFLKYLKYHV